VHGERSKPQISASPVGYPEPALAPLQSIVRSVAAPVVSRRCWHASLPVPRSARREGMMSCSAARLWLAGWFLALTALAVPPAVGQVASPAEASTVSTSVAEVIERGSRLEQQRRWAEALSHYEQALRANQGATDIEQRLILARAHYDVARRYNDGSFLSASAAMADREAIAIYDEVLQKVHTHYVHDPRWKQMVRYGTMNMEVALTEPLFVQKHATSLSAEKTAQLVTSLRQWTDTAAIEDRRQAQDLVHRISITVQQHFGIPAAAVIMEYVAGAATSLDEYSSFLTGNQMSEVFSQIEGNFVGLGVELKTEETGLLIVNVIPGGPASEGGVVTGDRIIEVDGRTIGQVSPEAMADMLRGAEGTQVRVNARAASGALKQLTLTRKRVEVPSVEDVKMVDPDYGVGYFKLSSFQKTTSADVDAALWKLHGQGMRTLIIDLRGNPGGLLKAAVDVADKFVGEGMIVATRGRSPREDFDHRGQVAGTWRVPLVVLIDHDSASASEILAGAVRDHRRGTVVGETSYGKGSVQGIFPLASAELGIRLTTAKWYTPSGKAISGFGVAPDVSVRTSAKPIDGRSVTSTEADAVLNAGLQVARTQVAGK
jgi:carboxyl-terminal processing protease